MSLNRFFFFFNVVGVVSAASALGAFELLFTFCSFHEYAKTIIVIIRIKLRQTFQLEKLHI